MLGAPKKDYRVVAVSDHASVGPRVLAACDSLLVLGVFNHFVVLTRTDELRLIDIHALCSRINWICSRLATVVLWPGRFSSSQGAI